MNKKALARCGQILTTCGTFWILGLILYLAVAREQGPLDFFILAVAFVAAKLGGDMVDYEFVCLIRKLERQENAYHGHSTR